MTYINLIYLGLITDRVPIIAMFTPSHIGGGEPTIAFGEVFDVPRFINESGIEIVEWDEVKDPESNELEDLGCWDIWEAVQYNEHAPRRSVVPDLLHLGMFNVCVTVSTYVSSTCCFSQISRIQKRQAGSS